MYWFQKKACDWLSNRYTLTEIKRLHDLSKQTAALTPSEAQVLRRYLRTCEGNCTFLFGDLRSQVQDPDHFRLLCYALLEEVLAMDFIQQHN